MEEFNCKSFEAYIGTWKKNRSDFNFKLLEFLVQKFFRFHKLVDNYFLELKIDSNQNF